MRSTHRAPAKRRARSTAVVLVAVFALLATAAACGSSSSSSSSGSAGTASGSVPQVDATKFTPDFALMKELTGLASQGKGMVGVLLPDTTSSARYVTYDAPYLKKAFEAAGLTPDEYKIDNAQGSASTMQHRPRPTSPLERSVLLIDPLDPGAVRRSRQTRTSKGVKVIDYDRLATGGPEDRYYVSFDNVNVGQLIGTGRGRLHRSLERQQAEHPDHGRRPHRQQRQAVRAGLQRRAAAEVRRRDVREGRRARRHVDAGGRRHDVRAAVHRAPEHQRGGDAERRQRQRRHLGCC